MFTSCNIILWDAASAGISIDIYYVARLVEGVGLRMARNGNKNQFFIFKPFTLVLSWTPALAHAMHYTSVLGASVMFIGLGMLLPLLTFPLSCIYIFVATMFHMHMNMA